MNVALGFDCSNQVYLPQSSTNDSSFPAEPDRSFSSENMASRGGPTVAGTDGMDFLHRERVASHYQISAKNKSRLKYCICFHYLFVIVMLVKMIPDILDRLDIFILEIEELFVPPPMLWEYTWLFGSVFTFSGITAVRRNRMSSLRVYQIGTLLTGLLPVVFGLVWFGKDVKIYVETRSLDKIQTWQGYPWAMLVYAFLVPVFQLHAFSLFFAHKLASAWKQKSTKKMN